MRNDAATPGAYLGELPEARRTVVAAVRREILDHLPDGYVESMRHGMIAYEIPLSVYPKTYNGDPLLYVALAAQKAHYAVYLNGLYGDPDRLAAFRAAFERAGKRLDMGKSCVRFKRLDDLPAGLIGGAVAAITPGAYIAAYERVKPP